jgi:hypothetical protein
MAELNCIVIILRELKISLLNAAKCKYDYSRAEEVILPFSTKSREAPPACEISTHNLIVQELNGSITFYFSIFTLYSFVIAYSNVSRGQTKCSL